MLGCSVNGVVCIHNQGDRDITLWNPSIQKFKKIPSPTSEYGLEIDLELGVGYHSANDDFKIFGIAEFGNSENVYVSSEISVYSLNSNSWRRIQDLPCGFETQNSDIVFLHGAWSWLMHNKLDKTQCIILTLCIGSFAPQWMGTTILLWIWRFWGDLYVFLLIMEAVDMMFGLRTVAESWSLLYSIDQETVPWLIDSCKPLTLSKNSEMVLLKKEDHALLWFDLETKKSNKFKVGGFRQNFEATICVRSLSLLDGDPVIVGRQQ